MEIRTLAPFRAAVVCECRPLGAIGEVVGRDLAEVRAALEGAGIPISGAPFVAWSNVYEDGTAEAHIGWPVAEAGAEAPPTILFDSYGAVQAVVHRDVPGYDEVDAIDPAADDLSEIAWPLH